jgi:hypothetical protein
MAARMHGAAGSIANSDALLAENGPFTLPRVKLEDGYAIVRSGTFPHLDRILDVAEEILAERSGAARRKYRSFF